VIARNSSFTYRGRSVDVRRIGRELGVRYVVEGSVRRVAEQARITVQLIDVLTNSQIGVSATTGPLSMSSLCRVRSPRRSLERLSPPWAMKNVVGQYEIRRTA
jgi:hypothetical protein